MPMPGVHNGLHRVENCSFFWGFGVCRNHLLQLNVRRFSTSEAGVKVRTKSIQFKNLLSLRGVSCRSNLLKSKGGLLRRSFLTPRNDTADKEFSFKHYWVHSRACQFLLNAISSFGVVVTRLSLLGTRTF
jgi:hypothetical protein